MKCQSSALEYRTLLAGDIAIRLDGAMLTTVVFTIFGADRPGLVEAVSACVTSHGGNWLESRLLHLGGHFAGIVRVEVEKPRRDELLTALRSLSASGPGIVLHEADAPQAAPLAGTPASLEIVGHDRPGIVRELARVLAARGVNVEELTTERTSAPMSGEPIFQAHAEITLPPGLDAAVLRRELEQVASDLMVDFTFRAHG